MFRLYLSVKPLMLLKSDELRMAHQTFFFDPYEPRNKNYKPDQSCQA